MSPTKKKSAKKKAAASGAKKKAGAKASPKPAAAKAKAPRKKAAAAKKKATSKKTAAPKKTAAAKPAPKRTAAKKPVAPRAKAAAESPTPIETEQKAATPEHAARVEAAREPAVPKKRTPRGKPTPLSTMPHPKFGFKFECFKCQAKFYDLGKPDPICPKCGADQRDRPRTAPKQPPHTVRRLGDRPIVPLLDDEDEATSEVVSFEETADVPAASPAVDMFDDEDDAAVDDEEIFEVGERKPISQLIVDDSEEP